MLQLQDFQADVFANDIKRFVECALQNFDYNSIAS